MRVMAVDGHLDFKLELKEHLFEFIELILITVGDQTPPNFYHVPLAELFNLFLLNLHNLVIASIIIQYIPVLLCSIVGFGIWIADLTAQHLHVDFLTFLDQLVYLQQMLVIQIMARSQSH